MNKTDKGRDAASEKSVTADRHAYILDGERLDDLQRNGLYIIQNPKRFCFGMDAVLLSGFASEHASIADGNILDLCTGNGIIPLLLSAKTKASHIVGMEIQPEIADMADRSVRMNALSDKIEILTCDIKEVATYADAASFDMVTVNPPYFKAGHGITNQTESSRKARDTKESPGISGFNSKTISRHEVACTLEDVLRTAAFALREGGYFYIVHKPQRLSDVICCMREAGIEPKTLKTVHPRIDAEPSMILIEGRKGAGAETRIEPPLIIYGDDGKYTEEMYAIYG